MQTHPVPRPLASWRTLALAAVSAAVLALAPTLRAGLIYATDFGSNPWSTWNNTDTSTVTASTGVTTNRYYSTAEGTIDTRPGSGGACLVFDGNTTGPGVGPVWSVATSSGPVPRQNANTVTDLASLTLGVDLQGNRQARVTVRISSLNASNTVTGTLETTFELARVNTWQRFTADLSTFTPVTGTFAPTAPAFEYTFITGSALGWPAGQQYNIVRVDNLTLAAPSFYVQAGSTVPSPTGRSTSSPFTTLQAAIDAAVPGDVIHILNPINSATYTQANHATISKVGAPAGWIVIRPHPGHNPELISTDWNNIKIVSPAAYIEIRDLTFRGNRANVTDLALAEADFDLGTEQNNQPYYGSGFFNGNGLNADGREKKIVGTKPDGTPITITDPDKGVHHLRFIRNIVYDHCGAGISAIHADHVAIEDNIVYRNSHYTRYATSGISVFRSWNFDLSTGVKNFVLRNEAFENECKVKWIDTNPAKISDGNGIIIDDNLNSQPGASGVAYLGRTLVANNLAYNNGGAGVQIFKSRFVDVFHNTAYYNSKSPTLNYGQIFAGFQCTDVNVANNVWWAQTGKVVELIANNSTGIAYRNNLVFGDGFNLIQRINGIETPIHGTVDISPVTITNPTTGATDLVRSGNSWAAPGFLNPSLDSTTADFRLAANSLGVNSATYTTNGMPVTDLVGLRRPLDSAPDCGAFEGGHHSRQAELFTALGGSTASGGSTAPTTQTISPGFTGASYLDFGLQNSYAEWNNFAVPDAGTYRLVLRYANGSGANRPCALVVNGVTIGTLAFPRTGDWAAWDLLAMDVPLNAGNNTLRLTANTSAGGPNLDRLDAARR